MVGSDDVYIPSHLNALCFYTVFFMALLWTFVGFWLPRNHLFLVSVAVLAKTL